MVVVVLPQEVLRSADPTTDSDGLLISNGAFRIVQLPHPRTNVATLFLCTASHESQKSALYELQAVSPPDPRSWFVGESVIADGRLLVATAIDPVFLLVPILQSIQPIDGTAGNFRPADDLFDEVANKFVATNVHDIGYFTSLPSTHDALARLCEVKVISNDLTVYRFSSARVLEYLKKKVARLAKGQIQDRSQTIVRGHARDGLMEDGREELLESARIKAACGIVCQYVSESFRTQLLESYDFSKLDAHLQLLQAEAMAMTTTTTTKSKSAAKKNAAASNDNKKRKSSKSSMGVDKLMKANVTGMSKISSYFKKPS